MGTAALVIHPDGEIIDVNLKPGVSHLPIMYEQLGCSTVDVVALTDRLDMWLDDQGVFTQPVNPVATALARHYGLTHQLYHGPVMLCSVTRGGASVDLTVHQLRALLVRLMDVADVL